jgi:hypothetical protein
VEDGTGADDGGGLATATSVDVAVGLSTTLGALFITKIPITTTNATTTTAISAFLLIKLF